MCSKKNVYVFILSLVFYLNLAGIAGAHFSSSGYSDIQAMEDTLRYHLSLTEHDLLQILPADQDGDGKVGKAVIEEVKHEKRASIEMIGIDLLYPFGSSVDRFLVQYNFLWYDGTDPKHGSYATIHLGDQTIQQILNSQNYIVQIQGSGELNNSHADLPKTTQKSEMNPVEGTTYKKFSAYTQMGMEHIWSGIDHILFLFGLLLASWQRTWTIVKLISAFTVGHSITLILASLDLVYLSPKIVEPLIALSILYIAVGNIWRRQQESRRIGVTLLFGLVHGFGFAEILRGTLTESMALPLFSFNFGVEIGQLVVLAIAFPVLWASRRVMGRINWAPYASGIIGVFGLYWFVERIFSL